MNSIISKNLGFVWLLSFVCSLFWFRDYQIEMFGTGVLALFAWGYSMLARGIDGGWKLEQSKVLLFAGLFWALVVGSIFWSDVKPISVISACFFSALPLTFFAFVMTGTATDFKKIGYLLGAFFAVLAVWAVVQFFFLNAYFLGQARHPLADPSSLGALFSLVLFCSLGWMLSDRPAREHKMAVVLSSLLVCGIMATVSRGPIFAFLPGLVFLCVFLWPQIKARRKSLMIVVFSGVAFFGLMQTGVQKHYDLWQRLYGTVVLQENTSNNRIAVWSSAIEMVKEHPWLGTGIGTFGVHYPEYRSTADRDGVYLAHNDPLQFWTELGVLGPLLFYAFAVAAALRSFAALKVLKDDKDRQDRIIVASIFAALVSMVAHSHVSFNHYNVCILMITGLLLAVWFMVSARALRTQTIVSVMPENLPPVANRFLIALPFLMMGWILVSILAGEHFYNRARDNLFKEEMFEFADNINKANRVSHGMSYRTLLLAVNVPMTILEIDGTRLKDNLVAQKNLYEQATGYLQDVMAINPYDASTYFYLGKVQTLVSKEIVPEGTPSPEEYYKLALRYNPLHLGARMALFEVYNASGTKTASQIIDFMEEGLGYTYTTPMASQYYNVLGKIYLEDKRYDKTKELMQIVYEFQRRSRYSKQKQSTSIPEALTGGDALLERQ